VALRVLLAVVWAVLGVLSSWIEGTGARRPEPGIAEVPDVRRPLPGPSARDPIVQVSEGKPCEDACIGTAFVVDDHGHWLTARHVLTGCRQIAIVTGPHCGIRAVEIAQHPRADVVLLESDPAAPPLARGARALVAGQDGFHLGYPQGDPGDVHGELMGRVNVRGRHAGEPGMLWAEIERDPDNDLPLGGLSGGPVLDADGGVVGMAIAASPRRGRVTSAAPESLDELLAQAGLALPALAPGGERTAVGRSNYAAVGRDLRQRLSVAKVVCWHQETASRRGR